MQNKREEIENSGATNRGFSTQPGDRGEDDGTNEQRSENVLVGRDPRLGLQGRTGRILGFSYARWSA
jgi:hypothetical protein